MRQRTDFTHALAAVRTLNRMEFVGDTLPASAGLHLSEEELARLDKVSDPGAADCPYGVPGLEQRSRNVAGGR